MPHIIHSFPLLAVVAVLAYLLGAVPFGIVMARIFGLGDLRAIGSGNIGATNVLRTGNKLAAFLTLILDAGKGAIAVGLAWALFRQPGQMPYMVDAAQVAGFFAFLGHIYPVYLRFRGGKGVATFLGTLLALSFPLGLACCATWLVVAVITRYSSLAALAAAALSSLWILLLGQGGLLLLMVLFTILIYLRHWQNITRLRAGTETKIGAKKG
ncbi:glycerol-3-phosphate 1-O-acyltransferase PlsY [Acidimangrovimonas sediminis]|uniref:glycerol-3-phosphate 1-O-acyltransferase PlsY n=1 Tax=Acidimangrovimonas sediminis TaxID=2056283 RepID=UPI001E517E7E|nr:glycerol-3-phosphate 1-O-acyltransferase PlsY [Acidimangrovimonas sediminis]